ncbi:MAG: Fe-S assembly protein IscX [Planctomycetota bacterium]|nr:MAG: Fe-S assembly protein IscX [Planctomycetota bacterium]
MTEKLTWDDAEEIALALLERFPDIDPLTVRFTDLHQWVCELEDFDDDPKGSTEGKLERIQMAWWEEWKDARENA